MSGGGSVAWDARMGRWRAVTSDEGPLVVATDRGWGGTAAAREAPTKPSRCAKGSVPAEVRAQLADPARLPKKPPGR